MKSETIQPILSIIIPVYNVEEYIIHCLDSMLKNYKKINKNFEIILVDDGSTDNSLAICKKYALNYSFIKIIHKDNGGLSSARNLGVKKALGKWITFIDSDDEVVDNYLSIILKLIEISAMDITMYRYQQFKTTPQNIKKVFDSKKIHQIDKEQAMYNITTPEWGNYAWNKIYRRELFKNIQYPVGKNFEDIYTTFKLIKKACNIYIYDDIIYCYRQRNNSIMTTQRVDKRVKNIMNSITAREKQITFFRINRYKRAEHLAEYYLVLSYIEYIGTVAGNGLKKDNNFFRVVNQIKKIKPTVKEYGIGNLVKLRMIAIAPNSYSCLIRLKQKIIR